MLPRPAKSMQNGAGFSGKTSTYWACRKGKSGLSATVRAVDKYVGAAFAKRKRNRTISPEYQIMRGGELHLCEREGIRAGAWRGKRGLHTKGKQIPRRKGRASKKSLHRRSRRKHEWVSRRKSSLPRSAVLVSFQAWPNLKWERRLGDEEHAYTMKE